MSGVSERVYYRSPLWAKKMLLNAHAWRLHRRRYGQDFEKTLRDAMSRDFWSEREMAKYQRDRLDALLKAAQNTGYWAELFADHGIGWRHDVDPFERVQQLPLLDKETVKRHVNDFYNKEISAHTLIPRQTSGTTGSGLKFAETPDCERETWAVWWRYRLRHGIGLHQRCGYFGGRTILPADNTRPPYWIYNRVWNQLLFSGYHLSRDTAGQYSEAIRSFDLKWLHGYPSTLSLLAGFMKDLGLKPIEGVQNVTFGAESVSMRQRKAVQEMFPRARLSEHYGLAEGVVNISECERGALHVDEDFSSVELVKIPGEPGVREIVGSNWMNLGFPLLRYRTGDLVKIAEGQCACGRPSRIVEQIHGRREDVIELPDGRVVGRLDHMFKDMVNITEAQIHQHEPDRIEIRIVKNDSYSGEDEQALLRNIQERIGTAARLELRYVPRLTREPSGKLKFVVSHLGDQHAPG